MHRPISAYRRLVTWLGLVLLLASSAPHIHLEEHLAGHREAGEATHASQALDGSETTDAISSDDHHDEHSPYVSVESRPCSLCRSSGNLPLDRTRPAARVRELETLPFAGRQSPNGSDSSFSSLHPARAPPLMPLA